MSRKKSEDTRERILAATRALMEARGEAGVRMSDIAGEAGISRQAVYLHFGSRADLMVATARYGDEILGLEERKRRFQGTEGGTAMLDEYIEFWGNYIPEIYSVAKALLADLATDEAARAAWDDRMGAVRNSCRRTVEALHRDGDLTPEWSIEEATDVLWTILSVRSWENLTIQCGWSPDKYVTRIKMLARRALVTENG